MRRKVTEQEPKEAVADRATEQQQGRAHLLCAQKIYTKKSCNTKALARKTSWKERSQCYISYNCLKFFCFFSF